MRFFLLLALLNLTQLCFAQSDNKPAEAQSSVKRKYAVYVNYESVNMNSPKFRALLASKSIDRLILPFLVDGRTAFASKQPEFVFYLDGKNRVGYVRETIELAKSYGIPVYAYLDMLHWRGAGSAPPEAPPAWAELVYGGSAGNTRVQGWYASPFADSVWKTLEGFTQETQTEFPDLSGLYLRLELPQSVFYGYHPQARAASIRAIQTDPVDVETANAADRKPMHSAVADFRLEQTKARMKTYCDFAHGVNGRWRIGIVADPAIYAQEVQQRSRSLNDWLSWISFAGVSDVLYGAGRADNANENIAQSELLRGKVNPATTGAVMLEIAPSKQKGGLPNSVGQIVYLINSDADIDALPKQ